MNKTFSIYLDIIRLLAAIVVFIVHANYDRLTGGLPFFWRFADFGNDAVMVFFVLSGFVIAYVADQKEKTLKDYYISRLARLYSVTVPALFLTIILDYIGSRINSEFYSDSRWFQSDNPLWRLIANLFFINELWFSSIRPFSNGPFWSLGYEFWYYVIFSVAWYLKKSLRFILITVIFLIVGPKIILLFPVWLLGVWVYFIVKNKAVSELFGFIFLFGSILIYFIFRQGEWHKFFLDFAINNLGKSFVVDKLNTAQYFLSNYIIGSLVALHFIGAASVSRYATAYIVFFERPIRYLAGYTFAIYLFHYPILQCVAAASSSFSEHPVRRTIVISVTLAVIFTLGTITERRKANVKCWFYSIYDAIAEISFRLTK